MVELHAATIRRLSDLRATLDSLGDGVSRRDAAKESILRSSGDLLQGAVLDQLGDGDVGGLEGFVDESAGCSDIDYGVSDEYLCTRSVLIVCWHPV